MHYSVSVFFGLFSASIATPPRSTKSIVRHEVALSLRWLMITSDNH
jgi:hypothetical protein